MRIALVVAALVATAVPAFAHTGAGTAAGFAAGFTHPLFGLDHMLAMVSVGLFAAMIGQRALWLVPAAFVAMMAAGGALAWAGLGLPLVETGIALSVIVLGAAVALNRSLPVAAAMALVGLFAVFHGHAHVAEMPTSGSAAGFAIGFLLATAMLHAAGVGLGLVAGLGGRNTARLAVRTAGGAVALAGCAIMGGAL